MDATRKAGLVERLLRWVSRAPPVSPITDWGERGLLRRKAFVFGARHSAPFPVIGVREHQRKLEAICGGRDKNGVKKPTHVAVLVPAADSDKVLVRVGGAGLVGAMQREDAVEYLPVIHRLAACGFLMGAEIELVGGWDRGRNDRGRIGVRLCLGRPGALMKDLDEAAIPRQATGT